MSLLRSRSGGQADLERVEPEEQVLAEQLVARSSRAGRGWSRRGRGHRRGTARSRPTRRISPDSRKRSSLTCTLLSSSPTSSRKSVPPLATSNSPLRFAIGAGEGPLAMAEQLALDEVLGQGAAVDRDEGPSARRLLSWRLRAISSLPVPVSPEDHHGRVGRGDRVDQPADLLHDRRLADQQRACPRRP